MRNYKLNVRANPKVLKGNLKNLGKILTGKDARFAKFRNRFWAVFTREMFRRIHNSYRVRSRGGSDDLGNVWKPLKEKTIKRKKGTHWRWGQIGKAQKVPASPHPKFINRDQEELFKSLAMGKIGSDYSPVEGQLYRRTQGQIQLGTEVPHAKVVDQKREIIPSGIDRWIAESIREALEQNIHLLADLKD